MMMWYQTVMCCGVWCGVAECALSENGSTVDPQDDVRWRQSQVVMWPPGQALHEYALYWAIGFSSNVLYLLKLQWTYVGRLDVGFALFQDSQYSFNWPSTPQFGQPSKFAPAGRAPRAQWKKKELGNKGWKNFSVCQSVSLERSKGE